MQLPFLSQVSKTTNQTVNFLGLNRTDNASDGEMSDMCGLTAADYPVLTPRKLRGYIDTLIQSPNYCTEYDNKIVELFTNGGGSVYSFNGNSILGISGASWGGGTPKYFCQLGRKLFVMDNVGEASVINFQYYEIYITGSGSSSADCEGSLQYPVSNDNRIWACSSINHEIYACKLGDPTSWKAYEGLVSDSYAATVGTDGDFTGSAAFQGYVYFFKEYCVHRVYGNKPSNYQITSFNCFGVRNGAYKSLVECNGYLFYLSPYGIARFDGNSSVIISDKLGDGTKIDIRSAGTLKNRYYCCMKCEKDTQYRVYCYDPMTGLWTVDSEEEVSFLFSDSHLLTLGKLDKDDPEAPYQISEIDFDKDANWKYEKQGGQYVQATMEQVVSWYAVFAQSLEGSFDKKYISKLQLHLEAESGTVIEVWLRYDNEPDYERVSEFRSSRRGTYDIPIIPKRFERLQLKIKGIGHAKIFGYTRTISYGSEG